MKIPCTEVTFFPISFISCHVVTPRQIVAVIYRLAGFFEVPLTFAKFEILNIELYDSACT